MEEEQLLEMYRNAWDEFLEAYKVKLDQNEKLVKFINDIIGKAKNKEIADKYQEKLRRILEV